MVRRLHWLLPALLPTWAAAQGIGPDEIRSHAQPYIPNPGVTIRSQVELVEVPVVVRDRDHKAVAGLTQNDFSVTDDNKHRDITAFSVETFSPRGSPAAAAKDAQPAKAVEPKSGWQPRYVVIVFDDMATDIGSMVQAKMAAKQFVKTDLAPGDQVAISTTANPSEVGFTNDVASLLAAIDKVQSNSRSSDDTGIKCPPMSSYEAYLISQSRDQSLLAAKVSEYLSCAGRVPHAQDTVINIARAAFERARANSKGTLYTLDGLVKGLAKIPGRRMILLASSGFLSADLESDEEDLITRCLHAGVVINALGARGVYTIIPGGDATSARPVGRNTRAQITETNVEASQSQVKDDTLAVLASGTGGIFFHDNNDLLRGFKELGMVPEVMYVLGFAPSDVLADGRFHTLKVKLNSGRGYTVQARMGYNAPAKPAVPGSPTPEDRLNTEAVAADVVAELPAEIGWRTDPKKGISYTVHLDLSKFKFQTRQDRRVQLLGLVAVLRDASGNTVAGQRSDVELNLTEATYTRLVESGGLTLSLTLDPPPGQYSARGVLVDALEGKVVTSNEHVERQ